ncbi:hypothetical protein JZ751_002215 [Albula glossodonta]|uniref:Uncharacterized protein n=1 Tax=Albula glossodonta TaxID=121402 RepID=A0A8T2P973_9TELE|nr:hypothetical protein JZ751_002215 [Albula glossodonta]
MSSPISYYVFSLAKAPVLSCTHCTADLSDLSKANPWKLCTKPRMPSYSLATEAAIVPQQDLIPQSQEKVAQKPPDKFPADRIEVPSVIYYNAGWQSTWHHPKKETNETKRNMMMSSPCTNPGKLNIQEACH